MEQVGRIVRPGILDEPRASCVRRKRSSHDVPPRGTIRATSLGILLMLVGACGGCAPDARFDVKYASGFRTGAGEASVFGVVRDGLISQDAWRELAPHVSRALRGRPCDAGYSDEARATNVEVFLALDDQAHADGVSDATLDMVAPAAQGEFVLLFRVYGRVADAGANATTRPALIAHGGGAEPAKSDASRPLVAPTAPALRVAASLFSVRLHRSVAHLSMEYTGSSKNEALTVFARKLGSTLPQLVCAGWDWSALNVVEERDDAGLLFRRALVPRTKR